MKLIKTIKAVAENMLIHHVILIAFFCYIIYIAFTKSPILNPYILPLVLSLALMEGAQNMLNNYIDLEIDRVNKPLRPLPSGRLSIRASNIITISFFIISFILISVYLNPLLLIIFIINFLLVISYSLKPLKLRRTILGTAVFTSHYSVFPVIYVMILTSMTFQNILIPIIYVFLIIYLSIILKDYEDMAGDKKHSIKSLPTVLGETRTKKLHSILFLLPFILVLFSIYIIDYSFIYLLIPFPIALIIIISLFKTTKKTDFNKIYKLGHLLALLSAIAFAYLVFIW